MSLLLLKSVSLVSCQNWNAKRATNQIPDIAETPPTEDSSGRNGLFVDPEGNLSQDDGHDAGDVGLNQEETHFPLQMEVNGHDDVFPCRGQTGSLSSDRRAQFLMVRTKSGVEISVHPLERFIFSERLNITDKLQRLTHSTLIVDYKPLSPEF